MDQEPSSFTPTPLERAIGCAECGRQLGTVQAYSDGYDLVVCGLACYRIRYENWESSQETVPDYGAETSSEVAQRTYHQKYGR